MPVFDFSGIGLKAKASQDYGFLVDQLDIKRNQLESDGKLAPGDYDLLIKQARQIYSNPSLTKSQRSNVEVKLSQYEQEKRTSRQKDSNDITRLNNEIQDDLRKNVMLFGNNPSILLQANADALRLKIDRLSQSIDGLSNAGDDASSHTSEYNDALSEYNDILQSMDDVKNFQSGSKPTSNYVAYVTTNSSGEITDVKVGRTGSKTGYAETNGLYGGLQIYGKVNRKEFGKNIFKLGNETFSGSDLTIQDPTTPGAFRNAPLLSDSTKQAAGKNPYGLISGQFKEVDLAQVRPQTSIRAGGFAQASNGFLYEKLPNGQYKKYLTAPEGINETNIIKIPKSMEAGIISNTVETIDGAQPFNPPVSSGAVTPNTSVGTTQTQAPVREEQTVGTGTSRTPSPTVRAPSTASNIGKFLIEKAGGILGRIFNRE